MKAFFDEQQALANLAPVVELRRAKKGNNLFDSCCPIGQDPPADHSGRLWSLLDIMNHFNAGAVAARVSFFATAESEFRRYATSGQPAVGTAVAEFANQLSLAVTDLYKSGMTGASEEAGRILKNVRRETLHPSALESEARTIGHRILEELGKRKFLRVPNACHGFVDRNDLFGADVATNFKAAVADIREAGNCLAAECGTAAVFHLMRVVEHGLRALANDRRVSIPKKKPLELATWEDIIRELEREETAIQGFPKTLAREAQYEFVHGAMMQFRAFKNVFRNQIMHTRDSYTRTDAMGVFDHVKQFMQILAARISETERTPRVWRGAKWTK